MGALVKTVSRCIMKYTICLDKILLAKIRLPDEFTVVICCFAYGTGHAV